MTKPIYLEADCGVRYWEDASVNGERDEVGDLIPFASAGRWRPTIELDTGKVEDWPAGTTADIHYKVCDDGGYTLLDAHRQTICEVEGYVPTIMSPGGNGYGDYVIMKIGADGQIADWRIDLKDFGL